MWKQTPWKHSKGDAWQPERTNPFQLWGIKMKKWVKRVLSNSSWLKWISELVRVKANHSLGRTRVHYHQAPPDASLAEKRSSSLTMTCQMDVFTHFWWRRRAGIKHTQEMPLVTRTAAINCVWNRRLGEDTKVFCFIYPHNTSLLCFLPVSKCIFQLCLSVETSSVSAFFFKKNK